jgi:hypothetical protein
MDHLTIDTPRLPIESVRSLNALLPRFEERDFDFDLVAPVHDRLVVWLFRVRDHRRYAVTLGWNGFLRLRRYDSDDTRETIFESEHQRMEDFADLLDAFSRNESSWSIYDDPRSLTVRRNEKARAPKVKHGPEG